jgi:hypothetical protein
VGKKCAKMYAERDLAHFSCFCAIVALVFLAHFFLALSTPPPPPPPHHETFMYLVSKLFLYTDALLSVEHIFCHKENFYYVTK